MTKALGVCPDCGAENYSCRSSGSLMPMVLTLAEQRRRAAEMPMITLTERIYLDANGKATTDVKEAATLWGTPGMEVQEADALAIGYEVPAPKEKAVARPKGTKVVERPSGNK